ncbi:hypothetical protein CIB84_012514 [Bambusicola thoracicus]|uniref:Uncharacterized protein n=1 Tax=Bambusicola thoracicus TaxID=9083 RepID=A0A2P4SI32_BAMTH|nr:hypothetical protein CIB84_012514 [Bambusicola thoracicus]
MPVLILPPHKLVLTQESPSSGPSCGYTWSLHFLVILFTAKVPISPFLSPPLVPPQDLSSFLHQVLRERVEQGLQSSILLCQGNERSPAEVPELPWALNTARGARIP